MNVKVKKVTYGISTSVLFDMSKSNAVYKDKGEDAYVKYMLERAEAPLPLGIGFENLRSAFEAPDFIETVIISRNSPVTARRAMFTLLEENITPGRMLFTCGKSPVSYLKAYGVDHFRTTDMEDAQNAFFKHGVFSTFHDLVNKVEVNINPAMEARSQDSDPKIIKIGGAVSKVPKLKEVFTGKTIGHYIFDLDGVVFGSESEAFFQEHGLDAYQNFERAMQNTPMSKGPAFELLKKYSDINKEYAGPDKPFKLSVVTARGYEAAIRAIETLHHEGLDIEGEAHFLAGANKEPILKVMRQNDAKEGISTEFYDDQKRNVDKGMNAGVLAGHVPSDLFTPDNTPKGAA